MRSITHKLLAITLLGVLVAVPSAALGATTVSFNPASVSAQEGQNVSVAVFVNPQGANNYTVKLEIDYPADLLRANSFSFASAWMPLAQPGYDSVDNVSGMLIKTAGYPGGVSSNVHFGTISFTALRSGSGNVRVVSANSLALDDRNNNVISDALVQAGLTVTATAPPVSPEPSPDSGPAPENFSSEEEPGDEEEPGNEEEPGDVDITDEDFAVAHELAEENESEEIRQPMTRFGLAAIGEVITMGTGNILVGILLTLFVLGGSTWLINRYRVSRRRSQK